MARRLLGEPVRMPNVASLSRGHRVSAARAAFGTEGSRSAPAEVELAGMLVIAGDSPEAKSLLAHAQALLDRASLRADLEGWLSGNAVMKRTFRNVAIIAGLIERSHQGRRKSGRQATFSSDILYDTLRKYDPDHLMLAITRAEAMRGLIDFGRLEAMLERIGDRIDHVRLERPSPLAAPLFLEMGKVPVVGAARERLAQDAAAQLMRDAGLT